MMNPTLKSWAGEIGSKLSVPVQLAGTYFYLTVASGPLYFRPSGGAWVLLYSAMGASLIGGFSQLEIYNPTANAVTCQIFAGVESDPSGEIIDKRQLPSTATPKVVNLPTINAVGSASIPDLSGKQFNDPAGNPWLAVQRLSLTVQYAFTGGTGSAYVEVWAPTAPISGIFTLPYESGLTFSINASGLFYTTFEGGEYSAGVYSCFEVYQSVEPNSAAYLPPN